MLLEGIILEAIDDNPQLDGIIKHLARLGFIPPNKLLKEGDLGLEACRKLVAHKLGERPHKSAGQPGPVLAHQLPVDFQPVAQVSVLGNVQGPALEQHHQRIKELR